MYGLFSDVEGDFVKKPMAACTGLEICEEWLYHLGVPDGACNFAFIGEHVETPRDTVFTTEYAVCTGMEAVYTLLELDRGVPEVFASCYDVRALPDATAGLMDSRKITDMKLGFAKKIALNAVLKRTSGTVIEDMLKTCGLI